MCGYNPFYWYDRELDNEYIEEMKKEAETMLKDVPIKEFVRLMQQFTELELKIVFDLSYEWHDEEMICAVKKEYKRRGLAWN